MAIFAPDSNIVDYYDRLDTLHLRSHHAAELIDKHPFHQSRRGKSGRLPPELHRGKRHHDRTFGQQHLVHQPYVRHQQAHHPAKLAPRHGEARKRMAETPVHRQGGQREALWPWQQRCRSQRRIALSGLSASFCHRTSLQPDILGFVRRRGIRQERHRECTTPTSSHRIGSGWRTDRDASCRSRKRLDGTGCLRAWQGRTRRP